MLDLVCLDDDHGPIVLSQRMAMQVDASSIQQLSLRANAVPVDLCFLLDLLAQVLHHLAMFANNFSSRVQSCPLLCPDTGSYALFAMNMSDRASRRPAFPQFSSAQQESRPSGA